MKKAMACLALGLSAGAVEAADIDCVIGPEARVSLVAADEGTVREVMVSRGSWVGKGEPLIRLDDELEALQLELSTARAESDIDVRAQETRYLLRQKEYERALTLMERNVASETLVDDAEIELALTELAIEDANAARMLAAIERRQAAAILERRVIRSPVDGVVLSVGVDPGEFAHKQLTLLELADVDPLHVEVFAPAEFLGVVSVGDIYEVRQAPPLSGVFEAEVTIVDPVFDAASGTFGVRLELPNPDGGIPAGTKCKVAFPDLAQ